MWYWLFIKEKTNQYIVLSDEELNMEGRWILESDDYKLFCDSMRSRKEAEAYAKTWYQARRLKLEIKPITLKEACTFVNRYHRHHVSPQGHKFSVALHDQDVLIGVVIGGRPVARHQDDGFTLEVTRCCVKEVYKNAVSRLYASACRVAQAMGYKRVITYSLTTESGASLRASSFQLAGLSGGGSWSRKSRNRKDKHPIDTKYLWVRNLR